MGIAATFRNGAISAQVRSFQERVERAAVFQLQYLGEKLASYAKDQHNYTDRTGNLTNSIGYAVVHGSKIVTFGGASQSGEGVENALNVATQYAGQCTSAYSLVVVAGMNYAAYVEAKGYNVILPAELKARTDFPQTMLKLQSMAREKARQLFGAAL